MVALALALWPSNAARSQNPYAPQGYPAYPGYPGGYYPGAVGGAYYGQAELVRAQGELMIQTEQARIERQKSIQAELETKKKSFEAMMYEKANTPTLTENLQYETNLMTQRLITSPIPAEITSGKTLNAMLPMIKKLMNKGTQGPPVSLDPAQLKHVNVKAGNDDVNFGVLKEGGANLDWPFCLQGKLQKRLAAEIPTAVSQARLGALEQKTYRQINADLADLNEDLRKKFHREEINGGEFIEAKRFLEPLMASVQALRQPTSKRYLDGTYGAQGNTVPELAAHMIKNGLSFTACNPGEEAAYYAIHDRFVAYTQAAQAAAGFQVRYNPPRTDPWKVN